MVAANVLWRTIFARLLHHFFELQQAGGCTILMHTETRSVKCTFVGAKEEVDVSCVCGTCGTKRGMRRWVPAELEIIQGWPTLGLKSRAQFKSCAAHRKALKTGKGKRAAEAAPNPNPNTAANGIIPSFEGDYSAASFQGPDVLATEQRVQPARKGKLMRIPIVDSDIEHQLEAPCSSSSSSSSSSDSSRSPFGGQLR